MAGFMNDEITVHETVNEGAKLMVIHPCEKKKAKIFS